MNTQPDARTIITALGALEVQVASYLRNEPVPVTQKHLCNVLHKSDKTMASALYNLAHYQICLHSREGWSVTGNIVLLGLRLPEWFQEAPETSMPVDTCPVENPVEKGRNFSDTKPLTTSSTSSIKLTNKLTNKNLVVVKVPENKFTSDPGPEWEPEMEPETDPGEEPGAIPGKKQKSREMIRECRQAAYECGIGEPKATSIAELAHTTPEMIRQHVMAALAINQKIGLAIHRLENNHTLNLKVQQISTDPETRDRENRQVYVSGRYSEWVEH